MKSFLATLIATSAQAMFGERIGDLLSLYQSKQWGNGFSPITIAIDGVQETFYVAAGFQSKGGADYVVPWNGRGYVSKTPTLDQSNPQYFKPNLLGGSIEWDIDLSHHECGCIAAFYLVGMPGKDHDGNLWMNTDGWGYCDANQVAGNYCPEFDLMEANKWGWATTPHKCDAPNDKGFYFNCDRGGTCLVNIYDKLSRYGYGPGSNYTIDTTKPFHTKITFGANSSNQFETFTTTMT